MVPGRHRDAGGAECERHVEDGLYCRDRNNAQTITPTPLARMSSARRDLAAPATSRAAVVVTKNQYQIPTKQTPPMTPSSANDARRSCARELVVVAEVPEPYAKDRLRLQHLEAHRPRLDASLADGFRRVDLLEPARAGGEHHHDSQHAGGNRRKPPKRRYA